MTTRDRTIVMVLAVVAMIGAFWFLVFSPRRAEVRKVNAQLTQVRQQHDQALRSAAVARAAKKAYVSDRIEIARLGKAAPVDDDSASLIYQLNAAADGAHVDFHALTLGGDNAGTGAPTPTAPAAATQAATAALPPGAVVGPAGLSKLPFSLTFQGDYFGLVKFLRRMQAFTTVQGNTIRVHGRLFAVDGIALIAGPAGFPQLQANLTASAFISPPVSEPGSATAASGSGTAPASSPSVPTTAAAITGVGR